MLDHLRQNCLYAKLEKYSFAQLQMPFLVYVISGTGLQMDPEKLKATLNWPQPESLKSTQRFLGFANFYRQFIRNYSLVVAPIVVLTEQGVKTSVWPPKAVQAFETLKKAFASASILNHPDTAKPFFLDRRCGPFPAQSHLQTSSLWVLLL